MAPFAFPRRVSPPWESHAATEASARPRGALAGPGGGRMRWLIAALGLALMFLSLLPIGMTLWGMRDQTIRLSVRVNQSLARVVGEQTTQVFEQAERLLAALADRLDEMRAAGPLDADRVADTLRETDGARGFVIAVWVIGPAGRVVYHPDTRLVGAEWRDREEFRVAEEGRGAKPHIGAPIACGSDGPWCIPVSHALFSQDGGYEGVAVAAVDLRHLARTWGGIDLGEDGIAALARRDGTLFLRSPLIEGMLGNRYPLLAEFPEFAEPESQAATRFAVNPVDGLQRIVSYRALSGHTELAVFVGQSVATVLAPWRRFVVLAASMWLIAFAVICPLGYRVVRDWNRLDRQVRERTREIAEVNAELEAFTYTVSHDLRAPLRAIDGLSRALAEDHAERLGPEGGDLAARVAAAAERMDRLIGDLLAYSRLSRSALHPETVDLDLVLSQALALQQHDLDAAGAVVSVASPLGRVVGDAGALRQILFNLVSNAAKFVRPGVAPAIAVRSERRGAMRRIWVEDNGIGIAPEHVGRLFRVFERLHGQEAYPGTGIGLATVRRAAERLGGAAGLESAVGAGCRAWVELPANGPVGAKESSDG